MGRVDIIGEDQPARETVRLGPPRERSAVARAPTCFQLVVLSGIGGAGVWLGIEPGRLAAALILVAAVGFLAVAVWRTILIMASARPSEEPPPPDRWPRYTVLAALHDEAEVVGQLIERLARIDYPPERLQGLLLLEADDRSTITAALTAARPAWLTVLVVPPGTPRTKPRALNHGLARATGKLLTVYDAEDEPHPLQLREAAARFASAGGGRLACLQAPLRVRPGSTSFLGRQFAAEYAGLFETILPGMARLGLPFPLGGSSNHFRAEALRAVGGWDSWNVTEDADLGFRLWEDGWRADVIRRPTLESPPVELDEWLPQRARWLKGHMQTWGVHTRRPWRLGMRGMAALVLTIGAGLASAALHGPSLAWIAATLLVALFAGLPPAIPLLAAVVLILGAGSAWLSCLIGARRAGAAYGARDMIGAPFYWALLSLAFGHAVWRLARNPFQWDKTRHRPDVASASGAVATQERLDAAAPVRLSAAHAAAPEPVA